MTTELEEAKARLRRITSRLGAALKRLPPGYDGGIEMDVADLRTLLSAVDGDGWPERLKLLADDLDLMAKVAEHDALSPHREDRERALLEGYASGLKDAASDVRELFAPPVPEGGE